MAKSGLGVILCSVLILSQINLILAASPTAGYKCFNYLSESSEFYNVSKLSTDSASIYSTEIAIKLKDGSTQNGTVYFNVCNSVTVPVSYNCQLSQNSFAYFVWSEQEVFKCLALSSFSSSTPGQNTIWSYKQYRTNSFPDGYTVLGDNSKTTSKDNFQGNVRLEIKCDKTVDSSKDIYAGQEEDLTLYLGMTSKSGCGRKSFGPLGDLLKQGWILYICGIIMGTVLIGFGYRVFKPSLTIIIFSITFMLVYGLMNVAFDGMDDKLKAYITLGFSLVIGLILCYFIQSNDKISYSVGGLFLGGVVGFNLYILLGLFEHEKDGSNLLLWFSLIACSIVFAILGIFLKQHTLIIATSFGGSYMLLKSIGDWTGTYPDEFNLARKVQAGTLDSIPTVFWVYFSLLIVLGVTGSIYQYYLRCKDGDNKKDDKVFEEAVKNDGQVTIAQKSQTRNRRANTKEDIEDEFQKFTED